MNKSESTILINRPDLLKGWTLSCPPPDSSMTDEYNEQSKYQLTRCAAPFCGKSGSRIWCGPTLAEAFKNACEDIAVENPMRSESKPWALECMSAIETLHSGIPTNITADNLDQYTSDLNKSK